MQSIIYPFLAPVPAGELLHKPPPVDPTLSEQTSLPPTENKSFYFFSLSESKTFRPHWQHPEFPRGFRTFRVPFQISSLTLPLCSPVASVQSLPAAPCCLLVLQQRPQHSARLRRQGSSGPHGETRLSLSSFKDDRGGPQHTLAQLLGWKPNTVRAPRAQSAQESRGLWPPLPRRLQ